ncbi:MAG: DEAD/DEAH box helicase [Anaerolineales bacterium]|nr:MAG: DEAD/DEAH box helicase [Anaerolineales bacterium]
MPQPYIALDLETTGLDAERDAIIEVAAVRFAGDKVLKTFSSFVDPGRPIPRQITALTGIQNSDVAGAPSLRSVLTRLDQFVGTFTVVGHSVGFDMRFLQRQSTLVNTEVLDTFELAAVLLPSAERYSLSALSTSMGIDIGRAHRALDDALATHGLFHKLLQHAAQIPPRLLEEIVVLGERSGWKAAAFFRAALEEAASDSSRPRKRPGKPATAGGPLLQAVEKSRPLKPAAEPSALDVDDLAALLEQGGAFEASFPGYEFRPQQVEMLRAVADAFNNSDHLLVEAPTGVGKSLAYLVPAVEWAVQNGERVVVSTNTINLQEQLHLKDIPEMAAILPTDFHAVVLKGRSHYLCPARLAAMRRRGARSPDEARVLTKVLVWQLETDDGDGDALFLPGPTERGVWLRLSAEHEGCDPERCPRLHSGECTFYNARREAEAAHLVIVNHALLLADIAVENRALPEYKYLIVDEAHHLEAATTKGLSFEADRTSVYRLLREVGLMREGGAVTGLLADIVGGCQQAGFDEDDMAQLELEVGKVGISAERAARQLGLFFDRVEEFVDDQKGDRATHYAFRLRLTSAARVQPAWAGVEIAWDDANAPLAAVTAGLDRLIGSLEHFDWSEIPDGDEMLARLLGAVRRLEETRHKIEQMITDPLQSLVYWLEWEPGRDRLSLHAAPLHVGPLVEEHLLHKKASVILTSATLRTGGSFDYIRDRLNAWDAEQLAVGSPFDFEKSTLVYIVDDLPEPSQPGYRRAVSEGMTALFKATEGRALALFTSYSHLRSTLRAIKAPLTQAGITVQAQGEGISRAQLLEDFLTGERRVLLGTRSFWEGVDVPGDPLSCLAIAKLPFSVPTDPVFAARSETFEQPFLEYAVPEAILRFLQGFGRLIRTKTDRGIVVIFDRRLLTKNYGSLFIESLPQPALRRGPMTSLPEAAAKWLKDRTTAD